MSRFLVIFLACVASLGLTLSPALASAQMLSHVGAPPGAATAGGGGGGTAFVNWSFMQSTACGPCTIAIPSGFADGDLMIVYIMNVTNALSGTTVTVPSGSATAPHAAVGLGVASFLNRFWYKTLSASTDTGGSITISGLANQAVVDVEIYHGPTSAGYGSSFTGVSTSGTLSIPGFVPAANTAGVVSHIFIDRNQAVPTALSGWTVRNANSGNGGGGDFRTSVLDQLSGYTNATTTWAPFGTGGSSPTPFGMLVELLNIFPLVFWRRRDMDKIRQALNDNSPQRRRLAA